MKAFLLSAFSAMTLGLIVLPAAHAQSMGETIKEDFAKAGHAIAGLLALEGEPEPHSQGGGQGLGRFADTNALASDSRHLVQADVGIFEMV